MRPFNKKTLGLLSKRHITVWDFKKAVFAIQEGHAEEALDHIDKLDLSVFYDEHGEKFKFELFDKDPSYREFRKKLEEKGFNSSGLVGLYTPGYVIFDDFSEEYERLQDEYDDDQILDKIIDFYRDAQAFGKSSYAIPKV